MSHVCCCGNELDTEPQTYKLRTSPCTCTKPASSQRTLPVGLPWHVFKKQYEERTRLGLPPITDFERGARTKWH